MIRARPVLCMKPCSVRHRRWKRALRAAERLRADLDVEAHDLDALEQRFAELDRLAQSLAVSGDALLERLESLRQELTVLEGAEERAGLAEAEVVVATERALGLARKLHAGRVQHVAELVRRIELELGALCLSWRPHRPFVDRGEAE